MQKTGVGLWEKPLRVRGQSRPPPQFWLHFGNIPPSTYREQGFHEMDFIVSSPGFRDCPPRQLGLGHRTEESWTTLDVALDKRIKIQYKSKELLNSLRGDSDHLLDFRLTSMESS